MDQVALRNCRSMRALAPAASCPQSRSVRRGCAPSFSAHVRWGEHGAPVQGSGLGCLPDSIGLRIPKPHPSYRSKAIEQQFQIGNYGRILELLWHNTSCGVKHLFPSMTRPMARFERYSTFLLTLLPRQLDSFSRMHMTSSNRLNRGSAAPTGIRNRIHRTYLALTGLATTLCLASAFAAPSAGKPTHLSCDSLD